MLGRGQRCKCRQSNKNNGKPAHGASRLCKRGAALWHWLNQQRIACGDDTVERFVGSSPHHCHVPRLPATTRFALAVEMQLHVIEARCGGPVWLAVLPELAEKIGHRCRGCQQLRGSERQRAD